MSFPQDFRTILAQIGQEVRLIRVTRTLDEDGHQVARSEAEPEVVRAVVNEVQPIHKEWLELGLLRLGDAVFFVEPDLQAEQFDILEWDGRRYVVREFVSPPRLGAILPYKEVYASRESG